MFPAETAVLSQLNTVGGVLLILLGVVIALLALGAGQHDVCSGFLSGHDGTPLSVESVPGGETLPLRGAAGKILRLASLAQDDTSLQRQKESLSVMQIVQLFVLFALDILEGCL